MTDRISAVSTQCKNIGANAIFTLLSQNSINKNGKVRKQKRHSSQIRNQSIQNHAMLKPINIEDQLHKDLNLLSTTLATAKASAHQLNPSPEILTVERVKYCPKTNFFQPQRKYIQEKLKANELKQQRSHQSQMEVNLIMQPSVVNIESAFKIYRDKQDDQHLSHNSTNYAHHQSQAFGERSPT